MLRLFTIALTSVSEALSAVQSLLVRLQSAATSTRRAATGELEDPDGERPSAEMRAVARRAELFKSFKEGQVVDGVVKTFVEYGAFVDLGGIVGLLHISDIALRPPRHPGDVLEVGQQVKVEIIGINRQTQRIVLRMNRLLEKRAGRFNSFEEGQVVDGVVETIDFDAKCR